MHEAVPGLLFRAVTRSTLPHQWVGIYDQIVPGREKTHICNHRTNMALLYYKR